MDTDIVFVFIINYMFVNMVSSFTVYQRDETSDVGTKTFKESFSNLISVHKRLRHHLEQTIQAEENFINNFEENENYLKSDPRYQMRRFDRHRRNRRRGTRSSFDSISHRGGGLDSMEVENHYQRQLEELIRRQQQRIQELESGQTAVPDTFESVFPILNRNIRS